jgi:hypothetical protein
VSEFKYIYYNIIILYFRWQSRNHILLGSYAVSDNYDIDSLLTAILASGSPIVLFCLPYEASAGIVQAAASMSEVDTSAILWVFTDYFINYDIANVIDLSVSRDLNGAFFLYPYTADNDAMNNFMSIWEDLDPDEYADTNGNRKDLNFYSPYIIDSIASLALAYQSTLEEGNYEDGSLLRERVFFNLVNHVNFDGLSGIKNFNSFGDLNHPVFKVIYVGISPESVEVGNINDTSINIDVSMIYWPDGTQGIRYYNMFRHIFILEYHNFPFIIPVRIYPLSVCC